jgi:hypothetical protein
MAEDRRRLQFCALASVYLPSGAAMTTTPPAVMPFTAAPHPQLDRLSWSAGLSFSAYGLRFGLRVSNASALEAARAAAPLSWQPNATAEVDVLYSLRLAARPPHQGLCADNLLYCGSSLIAHTRDFAAALVAFTAHAEQLTAFHARDHLFIHAGVVGWRGRALLIPGRSMTGKTTLVQALVEAGATYYSDEFAVLDRQGLVHAYPQLLSIRGAQGQPPRKLPVESLGGQVGSTPLPAGLLVVTAYQPGATWRPRALSAGQALLALMDNAVAARREPSYSMPILRATVAEISALQSKRGDARMVAKALLERL